MARRRYQKGEVRKRGSSWDGRWREDEMLPDGTVRRVRRSRVLGVSQLTKREAQRLLDDILRPINGGQHRPQSTMSFATFVAELFEHLVLPTLKRSTQQIYRILLRVHLLPHFGHERLCDIRRADAQLFVIRKVQLGQSWESVNKLRNLLSKVLGTAVGEGYLAENPVRGVKMPARTTWPQHTFLSAEEVRKLLTVLDEPARTIALLATLTGLRIGEILALRWGRVDLEAGTLRVEETCYRGHFGTPKTRASRREVPLPDGLTHTLLARRSRSFNTSPEELVFATRKGTPLSANNLHKRQLRPACQQAGIKPVGWHTLRHTHTTLQHRYGTPLRVTQALLGHSRLSTTLEIYTHAPTDAQREAVDRLERIVLDSNGPNLGGDRNTRDGED